jgi:hypothetical protein
MATTAALTSKAIRTILKRVFPQTKFTVKCSNFAGGNSVHVKYADSIPERFVSDIVKQFEYGSFNGMIDLYEFTNCRDDIPQVKYVSTDRDVSIEFARAILEYIKAERYSDFPEDAQVYDEGYWWSVKAGSCPAGYLPKYNNIGLSSCVRNYATYFTFTDGKLELFPQSTPRLTTQLNHSCNCLSEVNVFGGKALAEVSND